VDKQRAPTNSGSLQEMSVAELCVKLICEVEMKARDLCRNGKRADIHVVVKPVDETRESASAYNTDLVTSSQSLYRLNDSRSPSVDGRQTASPSSRRVRFQLNGDQSGSSFESRKGVNTEMIETTERNKPIDSLWSYLDRARDDDLRPKNEQKVQASDVDEDVQLRIAASCASVDDSESHIRFISTNHTTAPLPRAEAEKVCRNNGQERAANGMQCEAVTVVVESSGCHDDDINMATSDDTTECRSFKQLVENFEALTIPYMRRPSRTQT
jgi:hypothetical protein